MKTLNFLILMLSISTSFAGEISLSKGESTKVNVGGCEKSEYGTIKTDPETSLVTAFCAPKTCLAEVGPWIIYEKKIYSIQLLPEGTILEKGIEGRMAVIERLHELVDTGVCKKAVRIGFNTSEEF